MDGVYSRGTLEQQLQAQGPLSAREADRDRRRSVPRARGGSRAGLVHRDIKAQNVMREEGGRIVLMDLGHRPGAPPGGLAARDRPGRDAAVSRT